MDEIPTTHDTNSSKWKLKADSHVWNDLFKDRTLCFRIVPNEVANGEE